MTSLSCRDILVVVLELCSERAASRVCVAFGDLARRRRDKDVIARKKHCPVAGCYAYARVGIVRALSRGVNAQTTLGALPLTYTPDVGYTMRCVDCTIDGREFTFTLTLCNDKVDFYAFDADGNNFHANGLSPRVTIAAAWSMANR